MKFDNCKMENIMPKPNFVKRPLIFQTIILVLQMIRYGKACYNIVNKIWNMKSQDLYAEACLV